MRTRGIERDFRKKGMICLIIIGMLAGAGLFGAVSSSAAEEKAVASKTWESVKKVISTKVGEDYYEAGQCTGYIYWCLKQAYGVDLGTNSYVDELENKLKSRGITKVEEGTTGNITSKMKPGDIIVFLDGTRRTHCAILGEKGKLYHAIIPKVTDDITLSEWMKLSDAEKNCDRYIVYRGLISEGRLTIKKVSKIPDITDGNRCYSLEGAEYSLYNGSTIVDSVKTDELGRGVFDSVPFGEYTLKELKPPEGYALDTETYTIKINKSSVTMELEDKPQGNPLDVMIYKVDGELSEKWQEGNHSQFGASLEGALYSVSYYDGYYDEDTDYETIDAVRSWVIKTDAYGQAGLYEGSLISGDELYLSSEGKVVMPLGTVVIREMKAPAGYVLDDSIHVMQITSEGTEETVGTYVVPTHAEQIIRGHVRLIKVEDGTMKRLSEVPFRITSKTTGESQVITTDVNGYAESVGIWFGTQNKRSEFKGALPYDSYVLDELACEANKGHKLIEGVEFTIYKNNSAIDLGTITNDLEEIPDEPIITYVKEDGVDEPKDKESKDDNVVDTGDEFPWWVIAVFNIMIAAAVIGCTVIIRKRSAC